MNGEFRSEIGKQWHRLPLWRTRAASLPVHVFPQPHGGGFYLGSVFRRRPKHYQSTGNSRRENYELINSSHFINIYNKNSFKYLN
ncbi:hypothetical protein J6590_105856 [Homalodisca vitripennis]|nr:hypothetical protein J6590_105856 [Homalodisca vitripennis]